MIQYALMNQTSCIACGKPATDKHHVIRRSTLEKSEYNEPRFQIQLCRDCHDKVHFSKNLSGLSFYEHYGLTDIITVQVGFDPRWTRFVDSQKYKMETK